MDKKESLIRIGKILVEDHGKQKFYSPEQVQSAHDKMKSNLIDTVSLSADILDFAMSLYSPVEDFVTYFTSSAADYLKLKTEAIKEISDSDWDFFPTIDIDMSWLDAGDILESTIEGIGSFLSAIFEGLA